MSATKDTRIDRIWSAVMVDGIPVCEVLDLPVAEATELFGAKDRERRPMALMCLATLAKFDIDVAEEAGCKPFACKPGRACPEHNKRAYEWWSEWEKLHPALAAGQEVLL